jgi:hypothetical protein
MSATPLENLITRVHSSDVRVCLVLAGAGSRAVSWLMAVPGASRTVLDAQLPYSVAALDEYVDIQSQQHVSAGEAELMSVAAYRRARRLRGNGDFDVVGLACTATIMTDRQKRGEHRCHVAWRSDNGGAVRSLVMHKGARDRDGEEETVSRLILVALAEACRIDAELDIRIKDGEIVDVSFA